MVKPGMTPALPRQTIIQWSVLAGKTPWSSVLGSPKRNRARGFCKKASTIVCRPTLNGARLPASIMKRVKHRRSDQTKDLRFFRGAELGLLRPAPEIMREQ